MKNRRSYVEYSVQLFCHIDTIVYLLYVQGNTENSKHRQRMNVNVESVHFCVDLLT